MTTPNEQDRPVDRPIPETELGGEDTGADLEQLQASLAAAEARALESKDLYMRALAEIENVRKRASRDVEAAHKYAVERFAGDLIDVKDSLELGLSSAAGSGAAAGNDALRAGTEATLKLLAKAFEKAGVTEIDPLGQPFNPELHEAMAAQPSAEQPPNTVMQVVQKGYQLNNRLLRPARVIVSREP
jgi:molecular chaperone GrpE